MTRTPDKATLDRIALAHPKVRDDLLAIYNEILQALTGKAICRFAYVLRTFAEQAELYAQGRTKPGSKVTNSPAGLSIHNYGLAVDIVLLIDKDGNGTYETASWDTATDFDGDGIADWIEIVRIFKSHQWAWGGDWKEFKDMPHFERPMGFRASELLMRKANGKVDSNGYVLV